MFLSHSQPTNQPSDTLRRWRWGWRSTAGLHTRAGSANPGSNAGQLPSGIGLHASRGYRQLLRESEGKFFNLKSSMQSKWNQLNIWNHGIWIALNLEFIKSYESEPIGNTIQFSSRIRPGSGRVASRHWHTRIRFEARQFSLNKSKSAGKNQLCNSLHK